MTRHRRRIGLLVAVAGVGAYWLADRLVGPFAAAPAYGRSAGHYDWALRMSPGQWLWYAALFAATAACGALAWWWPSRERQPTPAGPWRAVIALAVLATALAGGIRLGVLDGAPLTDDEQVLRFQAQTIAGGRLTAEPPPSPEHFEHIFLGQYRGRWFGQYGFGHPAILALGERVGAPGLIAALLTGALVILIFLLGRELFGDRVGLLAAALAAISPLIVSTGATLASQNSATALTLAGLWLVLRATATERGAWVFAAALALGGAFWCRQQEPALLGLGPLALLGWRILKSPRRWALVAAGLAGSALVIVPLLVLQQRLWGTPWWTNYQAYWWGYLQYPGVSPYGFGPAPWEGVHTAWDGLVATVQNLARLDVFLLGLPLTLVVAGWGVAAHRRDARALAVFAGVPLTLVALFFYFWPGLAQTGPQLYHAAGAVLLPFVAAGLLALTQRLALDRRAVWAVAAVALVTFWPAHLGALHRAARAADEIPRLVASAGIERGVVFTDLYPWAGGHERCFVLGRPLPHPDLSDPILYLRTRGAPADREAATLFADRPAYVLKQIDGQVALLPLAKYTGKDSLRAAARPRDLPPSQSALP